MLLRARTTLVVKKRALEVELRCTQLLFRGGSRGVGKVGDEWLFLASIILSLSTQSRVQELHDVHGCGGMCRVQSASRVARSSSFFDLDFRFSGKLYLEIGTIEYYQYFKLLLT